jgi:hypothetical protein
MFVHSTIPSISKGCNFITIHLSQINKSCGYYFKKISQENLWPCPFHIIISNIVFFINHGK